MYTWQCQCNQLFSAAVNAVYLWTSSRILCRKCSIRLRYRRLPTVRLDLVKLEAQPPLALCERDAEEASDFLCTVLHVAVSFGDLEASHHLLLHHLYTHALPSQIAFVAHSP
jgi:hypothetical protein